MNPRLFNTIESHRLARRRWPVAAAITLSVALAFTGTAAASAADVGDAADRSVAAATPATPTGRVVEFPMNLLWTNGYWSHGDTYYRPGADIPVGADVRTLLLDVDIAAFGPVDCDFEQEEEEDPGRSAVARWTEDEWASDAPKTIPIAEGIVIAHTGSYILDCYSTSADGQRWWQLKWWLASQRTDQGAVVVLHQDEELLSSFRIEDVYNTLGDPRPVSTGDTVRLSGAPGTWPQAPDQDPYPEDPVITLSSGGSGTESITVDDAVIAADGSILEFIVPAAPAPDFFTEDATFSVQKTQWSDPFSSDWRINRKVTLWTAPLVFAAQPVAPTIAMSLSARYALSFQRLTATAVVNTAGIPTPSGTVTFAVNGEPVGTVPLTAAANGKASFRLPTLARGRYSITATFTPGTGSAPAVSPGAWLRVLR